MILFLLGFKLGNMVDILLLMRQNEMYKIIHEYKMS